MLSPFEKYAISIYSKMNIHLVDVDLGKKGSGIEMFTYQQSILAQP